MLDDDDRLELSERHRQARRDLGYEGEPYLAFRDGRVYRNMRSPATYLNDDRFGESSFPRPRTRRRRRSGSRSRRRRAVRLARPPHPLDERDAAAQGRGREDEAHHVFDWTVPATLDGAPLASPGRSTTSRRRTRIPPILLVPLVLLIILGVLLVVLRHRRASREETA